MAIPIQHLLQDQPPLVTISPVATLQEALDKMIEHDFTQLPVVEDGKLYGKPATLVTSQSIARAVRVFKTTVDQLRVRDAVITARTIAIDEDLFSKMDDLLDAYAVLVLNLDGTLAGIVTNYDTTQYFRRRAEDLLLVEDVETTLKDHIRNAYGEDEGDSSGKLQAAVDAIGSPFDSIRKACRASFRRFCAQRGTNVTESDVSECIDKQFMSSSARGFDDLSLGDYIQIVRRPEAWEVLAPIFGISDSAFQEMLESVRKTRNKLMHFRPDIDRVDRDALRFCADWFKNHPVRLEERRMEDAPINASIPSAEGQPEAESGGAGFTYVDDTLIEAGAGSVGTGVVQSKYAPLAAHLAQLPRDMERIGISFDTIETIIKAPLPAAAREHRAWWANDPTGHVQSAQWLEVNWRVSAINMTKEWVEFARARDRERAYINFFSSIQARLRGIPKFPLTAANPLGQNWLPLINYGSGCTLILSFARRQRLRLECYIDTGDARVNEGIFEKLYDKKGAVEAIYGSEVVWERLPGRRASRLAIYRDGNITDGPEAHQELIEWTARVAPRFHEAIASALEEIHAT
jgi:CBS domain-containing protein